MRTFRKGTIPCVALLTAVLLTTINSPTIADAARVTSSAANVPVHVTVKQHNGTTYVFAVSLYHEETEATFRVDGLGASTTAEVIDEGRSVSVKNGTFADRFQGYDVHLYRIRS